MADCVIIETWGDTWTLPISVESTASPAGPINFTGATLVFRLETCSDTVPDFYFSDPAGVMPNTVGISIDRTNEAIGEFTFTLTAALMETLDPSTEYVWDVTVTYVGGLVDTLIGIGNLSLKEKAIV